MRALFISLAAVAVAAPALAGAVLAQGAPAKNAPAPRFDDGILSCLGPFAEDATVADLEAAFGPANVVRADVYVAEGFSEPGTVVFPDDPARRIEILWDDPETQSGIANVLLYEGTTWRVAVADGLTIGIGDTLEDLELVNGAPFSLQGFGWDYGGYAFSFENGRIGTVPGGCLAQPRLDMSRTADPDATLPVSGEQVLSSDDPAVRAVAPFVWQLSLGWPQG